jgi:PKD repeat protein
MISIATIHVYAFALGAPAVSAVSAPAEGNLSVVTDPVGAAVFVNGESKGVTPLKLDGVVAGDHRITVVKDGYLENSRVVRVEAGETRAVEVQLTSSAGQASHAAQIQPGGGGGGGVPTWVWIAAAAGGGTAAYLLLRDTNEPPPPPTVSVTPTTGLQAARSFAFSAQATDPDGDALTFNWDFGDSSTGTGQNASKVYNNAGNFTATVTASDGEESSTGSASVTVRGMAGTWRGAIQVSPDFPFTLTLSQNGTNVTGSFRDDLGIFPPGTVAGTVSGPNQVRLTVTVADFNPFTLTGTTSDDINRVSGNTTGSGFNDPFSITRQ